MPQEKVSPSPRWNEAAETQLPPPHFTSLTKTASFSPAPLPKKFHIKKKKTLTHKFPYFECVNLQYGDVLGFKY